VGGHEWVGLSGWGNNVKKVTVDLGVVFAPQDLARIGPTGFPINRFELII